LIERKNHVFAATKWSDKRFKEERGKKKDPASKETFEKAREGENLAEKT